MQARHWLRENGLQAAILACPFITAAALWDRLPDRIAIHWGIDGRPNGWAGKDFGLLVGPILSLGLALLFGWIPRLDPRLRRDPEASARTLLVLRLCVTTLLMGTSLLTQAEALGHHFNIPVIAVNAALLFFLTLGNYLGTFRPSYFVGIRTPWTLQSDDVWRATHRNAGRVLVTGSLLLLGLQFFVTRARLSAGLFIFVVGSSLWSIAYSYWSFRSARVR
jgi:uncharacterized membrane protein